MTDPPIPGLEPDTGRLDARYARFLGACKTCRAPILWAATAAGRPMPIDARPDERGNLRLTIHLQGGRDNDTLTAAVALPEQRDPPLYVAHFSTCPDANRHRKARR